MKHSFGGPWTQIKLDLLNRYLTFFNTALQNQPSTTKPFQRIYIDAFAGTGECEIKLAETTLCTIQGSAKIAATIQPPFNEVHLIDINKKHIAELQHIVPNATTQIKLHERDANAALKEIINNVNWKRSRGVLFLDPYGMTVEWPTLELIAATKALDVWYLFPLSATYRQAANRLDKVDDHKSKKLDSVLGTNTWREAFYAPSMQETLFDSEKVTTRTAEPREIACFVQRRLTGLFQGWVSQPIFLPDKGAPMFALFFAVSNPSTAAVRLSKRAAEHLFDMLTQNKIGKNHALANLDNGELFM